MTSQTTPSVPVESHIERLTREITHDVRSQLTGSIGHLDILLASDLSEQQRSFLQSVKASNLSLAYLFTGLGDLNRLASGKLESKESIFSAQKIWGDLAFILSEPSDEKGISIKFDSDVPGPIPITASSRQIGFIIFQLLTYIVQNSGGSEFYVNVETRKGAAGCDIDEPHLLFSINCEVDWPACFSQQIPLSDQSEKLLSDLGLAVCHTFLNYSNGIALRVQEDGKDRSTLEFSVPIHDLDTRPKQSSPHKKTEPNIHKTQRSKILLADDDSINRKFVSTILIKHHFDIQIASNGAEASELIEKETFDLVICDCSMPVMDGYETVKKIKGLRLPDGKNPKIIMWTGNNSSNEQEKSMESGADIFITKPVDARKLIDVINDQLSSS